MQPAENFEHLLLSPRSQPGCIFSASRHKVAFESLQLALQFLLLQHICSAGASQISGNTQANMRNREKKHGL